MLQHATGHHADRALFHKRFEDFPQCHRHPCPSFTGSLLLARGIKLPENRSTLEGLGLAGFTPTPYQSGESAREQGITKSGNRHGRWMTSELAWSWLRFQPASALSVWFRERFGSGGKRLRRMGMVAVARKLLIALWRFLETGVLPAGAVLKAE